MNSIKYLECDCQELVFKEIQKDDIQKINNYFKLRSNKTCDSIFLDVFLWKDYYKVRFAIWNEKALFLTMKVDGVLYTAMPLCLESDLAEAFNIIKNYFNKILNKNLKVFLADETSLEILNMLEVNNKEFYVFEADDAKDYIYSAEALKVLSGKKLRKKKNHINSFLREYEGRFEYKTLCCSSSYQILEFLEDWKSQKENLNNSDSNSGENALDSHLEGELAGIEQILDNCKLLNITMAGIYIDDNLEAFTIGSYNKVEKMAIIHIEKANPDIRGLYPFINQQFIINAFPEALIVNREDDLGLEGLRKAKLSYEPVDYARKYRVEQKN
ncbi:MAG: phosphatidylglycerol lysyltransferase domain-containing protein [bacterium]